MQIFNPCFCTKKQFLPSFPAISCLFPFQNADISHFIAHFLVYVQKKLYLCARKGFLQYMRKALRRHIEITKRLLYS